MRASPEAGLGSEGMAPAPPLARLSCGSHLLRLIFIELPHVIIRAPGLNGQAAWRQDFKLSVFYGFLARSGKHKSC